MFRVSFKLLSDGLFSLLDKDCFMWYNEEHKVLEIGKWEHWHRGEKKINIQKLLELTEEVYQEINS